MDLVNSFAGLDLSAEAPTWGVTPRSGLRPPSPGTSPLFSTPSSAMSGSTGGVLGGHVTPILCGATADWCGGAIGGSKGGRFCCKEAAKCTIQSHRTTQKVALASSTLYLQGPRVGQARLEPSIGVEDLPASMAVKELLSMKKSSEILTVYFTNMAGQLKDEFLGEQMDSTLSSPG
eukprot:scaffold245320_cov32-Attheya_sp.AAC.1